LAYKSLVEFTEISSVTRLAISYSLAFSFTRFRTWTCVLRF